MGWFKNLIKRVVGEKKPDAKKVQGKTKIRYRLPGMRSISKFDLHLLKKQGFRPDKVVRKHKSA